MKLHIKFGILFVWAKSRPKEYFISYSTKEINIPLINQNLRHINYPPSIAPMTSKSSPRPKIISHKLQYSSWTNSKYSITSMPLKSKIRKGSKSI